VTTAKRLGLASVALISIGASSAYYATMMALKGYSTVRAGMNVLVFTLVAVLTVLVLLLFWRSLHQGIRTIALQLENMARNGQVGLLMADSGGELMAITRPVNSFLTATRKRMEELQARNKELEIELLVAAAEKRHTEAIIFSISDAVIVTNKFDELMLANEAAEKLFGFRLSSVLRKNIDQFINDGTLIRLIRETRSQERNLTRKVFEHLIDRKGAPLNFSITLSCIALPNDEVAGVVVVLHDVTREHEIARMKTDFVSNVSHELKTPLASITAYTEMLMDGEAADEKTRREFYEIIFAETNRLNRLIENILNISRIESGAVKVIYETFSLTAVAKQAIEILSPQAKAKQIRIVERLAPVYHQVKADRDMIHQAVLNLLSNAIKYTPDGGTVTVSVMSDERRGMAICEFSDTGLGISQEDLPRIFDKFYRVKSTSKMAKGTGLGLTLVKHIIETVHDGKLSVVSEPGKGSKFSFELPLLN